MDNEPGPNRVRIAIVVVAVIMVIVVGAIASQLPSSELIGVALGVAVLHLLAWLSYYTLRGVWRTAKSVWKRRKEREGSQTTRLLDDVGETEL